jgi:hypothetical protein
MIRCLYIRNVPESVLRAIDDYKEKNQVSMRETVLRALIQFLGEDKKDVFID